MADFCSMLSKLELDSSDSDSKTLEMLPSGGLENSWKLVSVPATEIESDTSLWSREKLSPAVCILGRYRESEYEVAIDPDMLPEIGSRGCPMNLDYNPIQPDDGQTAVHGNIYAARKARDDWLGKAASIVRSGNRPVVERAYRHLARSRSLYEELQRTILIQDIETSNYVIQGLLVHNVKRLCLWLSHNCEDPRVQSWFGQNRDDFLENLKRNLYMASALPLRTRRDEAETTSLFHALLHFSGGTVDFTHHGFGDEYSIGDNANLIASVLGITRRRDFEQCDSSAISSMLCESWLSPWVRDSVEDWTKLAMKRLRIGFPKEHLGLPSRILTGLGVGQIEMIGDYFNHVQPTLHLLRQKKNSKLLLLTWIAVSSSYNSNILYEWATSEDGSNLYAEMVQDFQNSQTIEQLGLVIAAFIGYRRLVPDLSDHFDQPIKDSYLADLDANLHGERLENTGAVTKRMAFAFVRVLRTYGDTYEDLVVFLETMYDTDPPVQHVFDGLSDEYFSRRTGPSMSSPDKCLDHKTAYKNVVAKSSRLKLPRLHEETNGDWIFVKSSEELPAQNLSDQDHLLQAPHKNLTDLSESRRGSTM